MNTVQEMAIPKIMNATQLPIPNAAVLIKVGTAGKKTRNEMILEMLREETVTVFLT